MAKHKKFLEVRNKFSAKTVIQMEQNFLSKLIMFENQIVLLK